MRVTRSWSWSGGFGDAGVEAEPLPLPLSISNRAYSADSRRRSGSMSDESYIEEGDESEVQITTGWSTPLDNDDARNTQISRDGNETTLNSSEADTGRPTDIGSTSNGSSAPHRTPSTTRRGWGEAPTYLEAMSSPNPDDLPVPRADVPGPKRSTTDNLRRTASGIRDLLSKPFGPTAFRAPSPSNGAPSRPTGNRSRAESQSALLHPTMSRFSTISNNSSSFNSPWTSTASLLISAPVPNSARRASFNHQELPRSGLTDQQMKFLASSEAVNLIGVRIEDSTSSSQVSSQTQGRRRRRSEAAGSALDLESLGYGFASPRSARSRSRAASFTAADLEDLAEGVLPPSWEEVDGERRRSEAAERRDLARPIEREAISTDTVREGGDDSPPERVYETQGESNDCRQEDPLPRPDTSINPQGVTPLQVTSPTTPLKSAVPKLFIPAHLTPSVQVEPPTPTSRPTSSIP